MARPKKNTVDYFPHDCHPNKELEIFINKHGNEGYAFYYRLFELLGVTPDHRYDCNKSVNYQYLLTKTGVKEDSFEQLMISLVDLDIVDKELWKDKIIWVQSFVDSIADVYKTRTTELPTKEDLYLENSTSKEFSTRKPQFSAENDSYLARNTQTKLNNTKKEESGVNNSSHSKLPNWVDEIGKQYPRVDVNRSFLRYKTYSSEKGNPVNEDGFLLWVDTDDEKDMNLKDKDSLETTLYCVKCNGSKQVPADKTYGHICDDCDDQMVEKHQLAAFRNQLIKEGQ
jgi:hypothetical protein